MKECIRGGQNPEAVKLKKSMMRNLVEIKKDDI